MARQHSLSFDVVLPPHTYEYGARATGETHGVVLTKPHIVRLILDLAQYTPTRNLAKLRLLEPSCGDGVFVAEAVRRLLASAKRHKANIAELTDVVRAYDIDSKALAHTKESLRSILTESGVDRDTAEALVAAWLRHGDFLLKPIRERFDVVIGNPPYVRIEQLDQQLQTIYRSRFETLFDRADLYVAFIERSLGLLTDSGVLSFICADRWTMNRYGAPLRELVAREYGVKVYVDLHQASPFESDVIAYPSIFVFERQKPKNVIFAKLRNGSKEECESLAAVITKNGASIVDGVHVFTYERWFERGEPWVLGTPEQLAVLRDLEDRFDTIEHDGRARVSIGVATGADEIFIVSGQTAEEIETDRLVPLVMRSDICDGHIEWHGEYVINSFRPNGQGIDLADYPKLRSYFAAHEAAVRRRHVSQRSNGFWFRTIDRVYPEIVGKPKLLIPDIAGSNEVAYDEGKFHPHHNLYFVTSDVWDLEVLGGLLSSKVALFFVWSYAVKMRGGYLRFQAQYLRRIRVPDSDRIPPSLQNQIRSAFRARDFAKLDTLALRAYGVDRLPEFTFVDTRR
jgi:methylase of polypeptide subunit release factors